MYSLQLYERKFHIVHELLERQVNLSAIKEALLTIQILFHFLHISNYLIVWPNVNSLSHKLIIDHHQLKL